MRRLTAGLAAVAVLAAAAPAAAAVDISVDRTVVSTVLGHAFVLHTTIRNPSGSAATNLVAHLNVLSLDGRFYVDPEDWSSHRTRYLERIPAHGATTLTWRLKAVNAGSLGVYVAVLPRGGRGSPVTGQTVHVTIADRRTLDAGGIVPLAVGMPALLALLAIGVRAARRRRHS
jgi:hypothetical protein